MKIFSDVEVENAVREYAAWHEVSEDAVDVSTREDAEGNIIGFRLSLDVNGYSRGEDAIYGDFGGELCAWYAYEADACLGRVFLSMTPTIGELSEAKIYGQNGETMDLITGEIVESYFEPGYIALVNRFEESEYKMVLIREEDTNDDR